MSTAPFNSDLDVFLTRAHHFHFPQPTKQQQDTFVSNVITFQRQNLSHEEAINLAFSITHWT